MIRNNENLNRRSNSITHSGYFDKNQIAIKFVDSAISFEIKKVLNTSIKAKKIEITIGRDTTIQKRSPPNVHGI